MTKTARSTEESPRPKRIKKQQPDAEVQAIGVTEAVEETAPAPRAPRAKMTDAERKIKQNAAYASWRAKLDEDPDKLAKFRAMKNAASKKFHDKQRALKAAATTEE